MEEDNLGLNLCPTKPQSSPLLGYIIVYVWGAIWISFSSASDKKKRWKHFDTFPSSTDVSHKAQSEESKTEKEVILRLYLSHDFTLSFFIRVHFF